MEVIVTFLKLTDIDFSSTTEKKKKLMLKEW